MSNLTASPPAMVLPPSSTTSPRSQPRGGALVPVRSRAALLGGIAYLAAAFGFIGVFAWLAARFDYPAVLDGPAPAVLPALLALGGAGRLVWSVYALLPLLLLPAGAGIGTALRRPDGATDAVLALVRALHVVAALAMMAGLARWPTLHWTLAESWAAADPGMRDVLVVLFDASNRYLGNALGEFVGELALYGAFVGVAVALRRSAAPRALILLSGGTGVLGWIGMFRNVTARVDPVADVVNWLLPLLLLALGGWLLRARPSRRLEDPSSATSPDGDGHQTVVQRPL